MGCSMTSFAWGFAAGFVLGVGGIFFWSLMVAGADADAGPVRQAPRLVRDQAEVLDLELYRHGIGSDRHPDTFDRGA